MRRSYFAALGIVVVIIFAFSQFPVSTAQEAGQQNSSGRIGDVKYSILDETNFLKENGKGWVLMDGRTVVGEDIAIKYGLGEVPDARGVFIRGLNLRRDVILDGENINKGNPSGKGDPEGAFRKVGSFQWDLLRDHSHYYSGIKAGGGGVGSGGSWSNYKGQSGDVNPESSIQERPKAGVETVPKNIALYIYIKVSDN